MTKAKHIIVGNDDVKKVKIGNDLPFTIIAGPCQMQDRDLAMKIAEYLVTLTDKLGIGYVFKASFDKANRNAMHGDRGVGLDYALPVFEEIRKTFKCPIMTDVHTNEQPAIVAPYVDMIQQPAFLIRQTDLSVAIAKTGKVANLKKAQFQAPWDMKNIIGKYEENDNTNICLTERGTLFGYGDLVVDTRSYVVLANTGYPVIIDATHCVQKPTAMGDSSGGEARMAPVITRAGLSTGLIGAVYMETHPEPLKGGSDKHNMMPLNYMEETLKVMMAIDQVAKENPLHLDNWDQNGCPLK